MCQHVVYKKPLNKPLFMDRRFDSVTALSSASSRLSGLYHPPPHDPPIRRRSLNSVRCSLSSDVNFPFWKTNWLSCPDKHSQRHAQADTSDGKHQRLKTPPRRFRLVKHGCFALETWGLILVCFHGGNARFNTRRVAGGWSFVVANGNTSIGSVLPSRQIRVNISNASFLGLS